MFSSYLVVCVINASLSYTATMLNIVTIHAIRKTSSLSKNLKTLLLSVAVSDLGVGLLAQPVYVAYLISRMASMQNDDNIQAYDVIHIAVRIQSNIFTAASLFGVTALCAERFMAIHLHLRYQELVTHKRVVAAVISLWAFSCFLTLIRFWIPKNIMYVIFAICSSACIITAACFSVKIYLIVRSHVHHIRISQLQQVAQNGRIESSIERKRKSAIVSVCVYLVFIVCNLPNVCALLITRTISEASVGLQELQLYTLTMLFVNSSINPLVYGWKIKQIRNTSIGKVRNTFSNRC